jgi:hypothetical protein
MNETTYIYIVHSDIDENNIYAEFPEEQAAIEYARKNASELTYVDKVEVLLDEDGEVIDEFDSETIWVYSDEETPAESEEDYWDMLAAEYEEQEANKHDLGDTTWFEGLDTDELVETLEENETEVECKECFDLFPKTDCVKVAFGYICPTCAKCEVADEDMFKVDFPEYEKFSSENEMIPGEPNPEPMSDMSPNPDPMPETEETENDLILEPEEAIPFLVKDEEEAIAGYDAAAEVVADSDLENKEEILDTIDHIKEEEEEHIEELTDLVDTKEDAVPENENDPISNPEEEETEPLKEDYIIDLSKTVSKDFLYNAIVTEGDVVTLMINSEEDADGNTIDQSWEILDADGIFSVVEHFYNSETDEVEDGDFVFESDDFDTFYAALARKYPDVFIGKETITENAQRAGGFRTDGYRTAYACYDSDDFDINVELGMQDEDDYEVENQLYLLCPGQTVADLVVYLSRECGFTNIYVHTETSASRDEIKTASKFTTVPGNHDYRHYGTIQDRLVEHVNEEHSAIESDQELEGTDNAVVKCKVADVVTHSEDEKPVDCEGKKKPLEKPLIEETHAKYAKPEGDRKEAYNNALKYAKKDNIPYIYGYSGNNGKFFAFGQPVKVTGDIVEKEKEFRSRYKNCKVVYVAYPDKAFIEGYQKFTPEEMEEYGIDEEGNSIEGYDEYVRCTWCEDIFTKDMCGFEADFGWLCDRCQAAITSRGERLTMVINPTEEDFKRVMTEQVSMTSAELIDKYGTDDVDLINAGKESEERVELKEEAPEYDLTEVNKLLSEIRGENKKKSIHMR